MTAEEIRSLLSYWQRTLRLSDWDIRLEFKRHADFLGNCRMKGIYKTALIELQEPEHIDRSALGNNDPEITLVHELLHVQAGQLTEFLLERSNDRWYDERERMVEMTAIALVKLRRQTAPREQFEDVSGKCVSIDSVRAA